MTETAFDDTSGLFIGILESEAQKATTYGDPQSRWRVDFSQELQDVGKITTTAVVKANDVG